MSEQLSTWRWAFGAVLLSGALATGLWGLTAGEVLAGRDDSGYEYDHDEHGEVSPRRSAPVSAPQRALYQDECASCHLAYPPGLLAAAKWQTIMAGLADHFGENAELDAATARQVEAYLVDHAADRGSYRARRYLTGLASRDDRLSGPASLRISRQPFFLREHDELPDQLVVGNEKVGSFSRCDACHPRAAQGEFDEDAVNIPGYGRWDD